MINELKDNLHTTYNIDLHSQLLRVVMTYETRMHSLIVTNLAKSDYPRYILQICYVLLAHMFIESEPMSRMIEYCLSNRVIFKLT